MVQAFCPKCKKMVAATDVKYVLTKNGRPRVAGKCPVCKGSASSFIKVADAPESLRKQIAAKKGGASKSAKGSHKSRKSKASHKSKKTFAPKKKSKTSKRASRK